MMHDSIAATPCFGKAVVQSSIFLGLHSKRALSSANIRIKIQVQRSMAGPGAAVQGWMVCYACIHSEFFYAGVPMQRARYCF